MKNINIGSIRSDGSYIGIGKPNKFDDGFDWFAKGTHGKEKTLVEALLSRKTCLQDFSDKNRARYEWMREVKNTLAQTDEDDEEVPLPAFRPKSPVPGNIRVVRSTSCTDREDI